MSRLVLPGRRKESMVEQDPINLETDLLKISFNGTMNTMFSFHRTIESFTGLIGLWSVRT